MIVQAVAQTRGQFIWCKNVAKMLKVDITKFNRTFLSTDNVLKLL